MENKRSNLQFVPMDGRDGDGDDDEALPPGISVAKFDYSVENHFKAMDKISELSGESKLDYDQSEIQRLSSSVSFLREWRHFCYQPQAIRFACQSETPRRKDVTREINLTQFSSAAVPKDISDGNKVSSHLSKDFVMYVGGLVWALDWCPRVHQRPECDINLEFIAIAAHPPESSYHKIGAPLTGRGVIQIWDLLNPGVKDHDTISQVQEKAKKNLRSNKATNLKATQSKRPRGRPRKKPINESVNLDGNNQHMQAQAVQFPEDSTKLLLTDGISQDTLELVPMEDTDTNVIPSAAQKPKGRPKKKPRKESTDNLDCNNKHLESLAKCPEGSSNMDKVYLETPEKISKEDTCRDQNAPVGVSTEQQQHTRDTETINFNSIKPGKPIGSVRKKRMKDSADNFDSSNQHVQPLAVECPEVSCKSLYVGRTSLEIPEIVAKENNLRNQNSLQAGVPIEVQQQDPRGSAARNHESCDQRKPRGRPRRKSLKEPVDNLNGSNGYLEALPLELLEDSSKRNELFLQTFEKVSGADTIPVGVSTEQQQLNSGSAGALYCNSSRPERPKGSPISRRLKESVSNIDGNHQYLKPLAVKFPEDSSKLREVDEISLETPEIVSKEDDGNNYSDFGAGVSHKDQQQIPKGSDAKVVKLSKPQKPKTHRKKATDEAVDGSNCSIRHVQALAGQLTEDSSKMLSEDGIPSKTHELVTEKDSSRKRKGYDKGYSEKSVLTASNSRLTKGTVTDLPLLPQKCRSSLLNSDTSSGCGQDPMRSSEDKDNHLPLETDPDSCYISEDVALPRLIMCLAHNGKVAWDVKWRPFDTYVNSKHRMGYLAVLLGNGALEVWEVPLPRATEVIFSACQKEGTDPRFIKLEPVFRCSMLKCGDRQSIPLTMEWSTSSPHDLILAGCHDGVVALWKFSANGPLKDTRPLLCFNADTVPIRALAWAPAVSDLESANIIVTAGHKGVKFWDIRDPFRPLWDVNPVQRIIYGLDWLPDPRCVVLSFDDGEIRIISLLKAACDVPVTGTPFVGTQLQGLHSYHCSSSSIWSVQVSRLTGMVAYCCSDGTVLRFQLTAKAVEKDPRRNREPHYLCGALTVEGSALTVFSPLPDIPFPMKKSSNEWGDTPRSRRGFLSISNQEKRAREQMVKCQRPEEQPLALCYGNGPGSDSGSDDTLVAQKSKHTLQTKGSSKKKPKTDTNQVLACIDEVPEIENVKEHIANEEKEVFPPKMVAMHCVRWNMNKGSERWLCYGGAGGIVRCQEISLPRT